MDGHICGSVHLRPAIATDEASLDLRELVLDVPQGSAVLLRRKVRKKLKLMKRTKESSRLASMRSSQIRQPSCYFVSFYLVYPVRHPAGHFRVDFLPSFQAKTWYDIFLVLRRVFFFKSNTFSRETFCTRLRFETEEKGKLGTVYSQRHVYRLICYNNVPPMKYTKRFIFIDWCNFLALLFSLNLRMFSTVHNSSGAAQKVPAVATDWWRPVTSRGLLTSVCEAVISQCWTCAGY